MSSSRTQYADGGSNRHAWQQCLLLTNDLEKKIEIGTTKVHCVPVVKYLLLGAGNEGR